ncbi:MAG: LLM class F420-dependent oxidoreductase [Acidimicrobiia bacterium]|nr:LLM class F420-dependent oxidoreductase [Acidimicrobiia bacterium]
MKLAVNATRWGLNFGPWGSGARPNIEVVQRAEALGYDSVWVAEAYGSDAIVPLSFLAAHTSRIKIGTAVLQIAARTPAMTAMTAATLDNLSGGRLLLGLGVSGPQVVEGWHNQAFDDPLGRTREYVSLVRTILARRSPVEHHGRHYDLPYQGEGSTGEGKAMKLTLRLQRPRIPIYLAAMGPRNVRQTLEIGDGWLPLFFPPNYPDALGVDLRTEPLKPGFEIAPFVPILVDDDVTRCHNGMRPVLAFWIGAMGSPKKNFYADMFARCGHEGVAERVRAAWSEGRPRDAANLIPDALIDEIALCGPKARIADQLEAWRKAPITMMILGGATPAALELMAELLL